MSDQEYQHPSEQGPTPLWWYPAAPFLALLYLSIKIGYFITREKDTRGFPEGIFAVTLGFFVIFPFLLGVILQLLT